MENTTSITHTLASFWGGLHGLFFWARHKQNKHYYDCDFKAYISIILHMNGVQNETGFMALFAKCKKRTLTWVEPHESGCRRWRWIALPTRRRSQPNADWLTKTRIVHVLIKFRPAFLPVWSGRTQPQAGRRRGPTRALFITWIRTIQNESICLIHSSVYPTILEKFLLAQTKCTLAFCLTVS